MTNPNPNLPQTVTVQGFAWSAETRTFSDKVLHEARNTIDAEAWIKRNDGRLKDLTILRANEAFLLYNMLLEHGQDKTVDVVDTLDVVA